MSTATHLHFYRCSACKREGASPVNLRAFFTCPGCYRLMAYVESRPILTPEDRICADAGGFGLTRVQPEPGPITKWRTCRRSGCYERKKEAEMVNEIGIGWFCSEACRVVGLQEWDAFMDRLRKLEQEKPWLAKERA